MTSINFDFPLNLVKTSLLIFFTFLIVGCGSKREVLLSGQTMGTTYHITIVAGYFDSHKDLKVKIDKRLEDINQSMSTYRKNSEISRFNNLRNTGEKLYVSGDFWQVMTVARKIYQLTGGAWDGTVAPLVNLWGFGSTKNKATIPAKSAIQAHLADIGFNHIEVGADRCLIKRKTTVSVDLASIAKGYAVDQVAALIRKRGIDNFLVEIGGEVYAAGLRKDGKPWKIGINQPQKNAPINQVYKVVNLNDRAFATSGDYRIYFEIDGQRFSHIIDPRTGYPVTSGVVSASIVAANCILADGLATALVVLGSEKGLELVNRLAGVECLIVVQKQESVLIDYYSKNFKAYLVTSQ
jgi:thiamine biosynthesis lipoprotein